MHCLYVVSAPNSIHAQMPVYKWCTIHTTIVPYGCCSRCHCCCSVYGHNYSFTNNQQRLAEDGAIAIIVKAAIAARAALSEGESLLITGNDLLQAVEHMNTLLSVVVLCAVLRMVL
jgi:pyruvate-formate lyase-activating enzyme